MQSPEDVGSATVGIAASVGTSFGSASVGTSARPPIPFSHLPREVVHSIQDYAGRYAILSIIVDPPNGIRGVIGDERRNRDRIIASLRTRRHADPSRVSQLFLRMHVPDLKPDAGVMRIYRWGEEGFAIDLQDRGEVQLVRLYAKDQIWLRRFSETMPPDRIYSCFAAHTSLPRAFCFARDCDTVPGTFPSLPVPLRPLLGMVARRENWARRPGEGDGDAEFLARLPLMMMTYTFGFRVLVGSRSMMASVWDGSGGTPDRKPPVLISPSGATFHTAMRTWNPSLLGKDWPPNARDRVCMVFVSAMPQPTPADIPPHTMITVVDAFLTHSFGEVLAEGMDGSRSFDASQLMDGDEGPRRCPPSMPRFGPPDAPGFRFFDPLTTSTMRIMDGGAIGRMRRQSSAGDLVMLLPSLRGVVVFGGSGAVGYMTLLTHGFKDGTLTTVDAIRGAIRAVSRLISGGGGSPIAATDLQPRSVLMPRRYHRANSTFWRARWLVDKSVAAIVRGHGVLVAAVISAGTTSRVVIFLYECRFRWKKDSTRSGGTQGGGAQGEGITTSSEEEAQGGGARSGAETGAQGGPEGITTSSGGVMTSGGVPSTWDDEDYGWLPPATHSEYSRIHESCPYTPDLILRDMVILRGVHTFTSFVSVGYQHHLREEAERDHVILQLHKGHLGEDSPFLENGRALVISISPEFTLRFSSPAVSPGAELMIRTVLPDRGLMVVDEMIRKSRGRG